MEEKELDIVQFLQKKTIPLEKFIHYLPIQKVLANFLDTKQLETLVLFL